MSFKFEMQEEVEIVDSTELGVVTGRAEYAYSENSYLVDYVDAMGRQQSGWFGEHLLDSQE